LDRFRHGRSHGGGIWGIDPPHVVFCNISVLENLRKDIDKEFKQIFKEAEASTIV